jgi:hypothetical protein
MTDATSPANGHIRDTESALAANPDLQGTSGHGDPAGAQAPAAPDSGGGARPAWSGVASPAGWFPSASGEAAPPKAPDEEPARADDAPGPVGLPGPEFWVMCHPGPIPAAVTPKVAHGHGDSERRSVWQASSDVWKTAGIAWEQSAVDPDPESAWFEQLEPETPASAPERPAVAAPGPPPVQPVPVPSSFASAQPFPPAPSGGPMPPPAVPPSFASASAFPALPASASGRPFMPLSAPTFADYQEAAPTSSATRARTEPVPGRVRPRPPEPDELFRAWQGSVRQAGGGSARRARRRRMAWRALRAGVPAAVIVAVGASAVIMLTGKPGEVPASHAKRAGSPPPSANDGALIRGASASVTGTAFPGYAGQRGTVTVTSMASADGTRLAVGSADGHAAIWRHAASGDWTLVSAASPAVYRRPGDEQLTSVAHGPAGWIAVGGVVSGGAQQSVVVTSADGVTWRSLGTFRAGPDSYVTAVTTGHNGYVVVGKQVSGHRTFAAMWWSANLRDWTKGDNGRLNGGIMPSSVYAVAAVPAGFVAVGTHGDRHAIWTSSDGRHWTVHDMRVPARATSAVLNQVTANGVHVVAAGYAVTRAGDIPIVVVSADGGRHWQQTVLAAPGGLAAVTALTAAGRGFVATGQAGPKAAERAVTWSSPNGLTWSAPTPVGSGAHEVTALTAAGAEVTGTAQAGAAASIVTLQTP